MRIQDGALKNFLGLFLQMLNASLHVCNVLFYILSLQKQRGMKTPKILPRRDDAPGFERLAASLPYPVWIWQNKRPMGHIAHLKKQFNSIIMLIERRKNPIFTLLELNALFFIYKKIFKFRQCIFLYLVIIPPWKRVGPFIWTNLNPLHPRMHCAKFCWNWSSGSGERYFKFVNVFLLFGNYLPFEKGGALYLNKLESSSPKNALYQVWLKLAQWFRRRRYIFFNVVNVFSLFGIYLPLEKGGTLHLNKLESLHPRIHCAKLGWNWPSCSGEEDKLWKVYDNNNQQRRRRTTRQILIRKAHLRLRLSWGKKRKEGVGHPQQTKLYAIYLSFNSCKRNRSTVSRFQKISGKK